MQSGMRNVSGHLKTVLTATPKSRSQFFQLLVAKGGSNAYLFQQFIITQFFAY